MHSSFFLDLCFRRTWRHHRAPDEDVGPANYASNSRGGQDGGSDGGGSQDNTISGGYGQSAQRPAPPPPPAPNPFEGVPQFRLNQINQLIDQWNQNTGYSFHIPDWAIKEMATSAHVMTLYDLGQYLAGHMGNDGAHFISPDLANLFPWAQYGMDATTYHQVSLQFDSIFLNLTGQHLSQDLLDKALHIHQGTMGLSQFQTWVLSQDDLKNTYQWLKYGLDYNQFQTQKLQMRTQFGRDLTNDEAVTQLQYLHAATGPNMAVQVTPTFTQQEKKQAQIGPTQSEVR